MDEGDARAIVRAGGHLGFVVFVFRLDMADPGMTPEMKPFVPVKDSMKVTSVWSNLSIDPGTSVLPLPLTVLL